MNSKLEPKQSCVELNYLPSCLLRIVIVTLLFEMVAETPSTPQRTLGSSAWRGGLDTAVALGLLLLAHVIFHIQFLNFHLLCMEPFLWDSGWIVRLHSALKIVRKLKTKSP